MNSSHNVCELAFSAHDHRLCEHSLLKAAQQLCDQRAQRLTRRRRQVLQILLRSHQPMGAYEILQAMNEQESGITPPIVYRALDFLQQQGLAHRIESRNAFIPCSQPGHDCAAQFLICLNCQRVAEIDHQPLPAQSQARRLGFAVRDAVVEINGVCASCQQS